MSTFFGIIYSVILSIIFFQFLKVPTSRGCNPKNTALWQKQKKQSSLCPPPPGIENVASVFPTGWYNILKKILSLFEPDQVEVTIIFSGKSEVGV